MSVPTTTTVVTNNIATDFQYTVSGGTATFEIDLGNGFVLIPNDASVTTYPDGDSGIIRLGKCKYRWTFATPDTVGMTALATR